MVPLTGLKLAGFVPAIGDWGSTVKDGVNDLIKNGMTLGKDIYTHKTKA